MKLLFIYAGVLLLAGCITKPKPFPISQNVTDTHQELRIERIAGLKIELWNASDGKTFTYANEGWHKESIKSLAAAVQGSDSSTVVVPLRDQSVATVFIPEFGSTIYVATDSKIKRPSKKAILESVQVLKGAGITLKRCHPRDIGCPDPKPPPRPKLTVFQVQGP